MSCGLTFIRIPMMVCRMNFAGEQRDGPYGGARYFFCLEHFVTWPYVKFVRPRYKGGKMKTEQLFYESINEAVRIVVQALGGTKKVSEMLWPALKGGDNRLRDCLNESRPEKLSPDELLKLARWGHDVSCHALANYFNAEAGYSLPVPISPADEKSELERKTIEAVGYLRLLVERAEAIHGRRK